MPSPQELAQRYAAYTDEELRTASDEGAAAYTAEAWAALRAELRRRRLHVPQLQGEPRPRPASGARPRRPTARWTLGLLIGLPVALVTTLYSARRLLLEAGFIGRGILLYLSGIFFIVLFGVALLVDFRRWYPKQPR